jgi:hypothetical protein
MTSLTSPCGGRSMNFAEMKISVILIFLAFFSQFSCSTAFSFFQKPPLVTSRCNCLRKTSPQALLTSLQGKGFASNHNIFRHPSKRNAVEGCSKTAKASDRDDGDDFWEMGDITEKLDKSIQPAARVSVRCDEDGMLNDSKTWIFAEIAGD